MDYKTPNTFIIIKGQPKALQIERFQMGNNRAKTIFIDFT